MPSSPRPSVDAPQSPTSPFLQSLAQRLRKGSTASHASSQSSESVQSHADAPALESTTSTKRYLLSIIRNDWDYPASTSEPYSNRKPVAYRQRTESISDCASPVSTGDRSKDDAYKFDSPDAVSAVVSESKLRKRRQVEEEMTWNDGLRLWAERRDAWTGAVSHKPRKPSREDATSGRRRSKKMLSGSHHKRSSSESTANTAVSNTQNVLHHELDQPRNSSSSFEPFPVVEEEDEDEDQNEQDEAELKPLHPYLPIYPPLLPASHSLRARIKPTAYPAIYSRVVIQSMTPNVPIPLNHMINALVDGWKSEGNWPPQAAAQGESAAKSLSARKKKGETAFTRWRREQEERKRLALERMQKLEPDKSTKDQQVSDDRQPGKMRKSISGAMRKVFGVAEKDVISRDMEDLGLKFEDEAGDGDMFEAKAIAQAFQDEENVLLNRQLLHGK